MSELGPFFLGIGAQKSGTSWLADYLGKRPEVAIPPFKEVHYWTAKYTRYLRGALLDPRRLPRKELPAVARQMMRNPTQSLSIAGAYLSMLAGNDGGYRRYLQQCGAQASIFGEITPAYSTLPPEAFRAIEACLDSPRYILLLRNPADRFISQIYHEAKRRPAILDEAPDALLGRAGFALRSDYATTLAVCRELIPAERLLVIFYEHLFDPERGQAECDRICKFLGLAPTPADLGRRVNARTVKPKTFDRVVIRAGLERQYRAVGSHFGADLPTSWQADLDALDQVAR